MFISPTIKPIKQLYPCYMQLNLMAGYIFWRCIKYHGWIYIEYASLAVYILEVHQVSWLDIYWRCIKYHGWIYIEYASLAVYILEVHQVSWLDIYWRCIKYHGWMYIGGVSNMAPSWICIFEKLQMIIGASYIWNISFILQRIIDFASFGV